MNEKFDVGRGGIVILRSGMGTSGSSSTQTSPEFEAMTRLDVVTSLCWNDLFCGLGWAEFSGVGGLLGLEKLKSMIYLTVFNNSRIF